MPASSTFFPHMEKIQNCIILDTVVNRLLCTIYNRYIRGTTFFQKLLLFFFFSAYSCSFYFWKTILSCIVISAIIKYREFIAYLHEEFKNARLAGIFKHIVTSSSLIRISAIDELVENALRQERTSKAYPIDQQQFRPLSGLHYFSSIMFFGVIIFGFRKLILTCICVVLLQTCPNLQKLSLCLFKSLRTFCIISAFLGNQAFSQSKAPQVATITRIKWHSWAEFIWTINFLENQRWWFGLGWTQEMISNDPAPWSDLSLKSTIVPDVFLPLENISESQELWTIGMLIFILQP